MSIRIKGFFNGIDNALSVEDLDIVVEDVEIEELGIEAKFLDVEVEYVEVEELGIEAKFLDVEVQDVEVEDLGIEAKFLDDFEAFEIEPLSLKSCAHELLKGSEFAQNIKERKQQRAGKAKRAR